MDDHELLREYVGGQSQEAFREIVDRHLPMVYSTARRMVGDAHLAEDVAQEVFTLLAQRAATITVAQVLGGWLYHTTRNFALHVIRAEHRRREREQSAASMQNLNQQNQAGQILQHLEPAMEQLEPPDRDALVLRYLEERSLREVGRQFGISEDAARMRVNRALERLRLVFAKDGITASAGLLASALGASTSSGVPTGLAGSITATALATKAVAAAPLAMASKGIVAAGSWLNAKTIGMILGAVILASTATFLTEHKQIRRLNAQNAVLAKRQQELAGQILAKSEKEIARGQELQRRQQESVELARLRGEVTQLRRQSAPSLAAQLAPEGVKWSLDPRILAQNPPVVLIRASEEQGTAGMTSIPEGTIALGTHLTNILGYAYNFVGSRVIMPTNTDTPQGKFDFLVTLPQGGREALQKLLRRQFGLTARSERRLLDSLQLTVRAANASGLVVSTKPAAAGGETQGPTGSQAAGRPDRIQGEGMAMAGLAGQLEVRLGMPVVDATGLTERYDYQLRVNPGSSVETMSQALSEQLGLELLPGGKKEPVDFLVVEPAQ